MSAVPSNRFAMKHNEGSCDLCTGWHDAEEAAFMNRRHEEGIAEARPTPVEPEARLRRALSRAANEGRNVLPDATDDQATVVEQWALAALGGLAVEPDGLPLDPHRLGGLIERAIRQSKRESGGLLPDGWTLVEMALAYPPETPTEPSMAIPASTPSEAKP